MNPTPIPTYEAEFKNGRIVRIAANYFHQAKWIAEVAATAHGTQVHHICPVGRNTWVIQ